MGPEIYLPTLKDYMNCYVGRYYCKNVPCYNDQLNEVIYKPKLKDASIFTGIKVKNFEMEDVLLSNLWYSRPVVLKVLPRLGCALCRAEARDLSDLKPYLDSLGVGLAAVAFEDVDLMSFVASGYWEWDLFVDPYKKVYKAANLHRKSIKQVLEGISTVRAHKLLKYLSKKGIKNNGRGDFSQLGGTFVIDTKGQILYQFRPCHSSTSPDLKELYRVLGGDPNDLDPRDFLTYSFSYTQKEMSFLNRHRINLTKYLKLLKKSKQ